MLEIPYFLTWAPNGIYTADGLVNAALHACDQHVIEAATLREESSQTNVILQYKLMAAILSAV